MHYAVSDGSAIAGRIEVFEFRSVLKNTLRGFLTVQLPSGLTIHEVSVHVQFGKTWALPPSRPMLDAGFRQMVDRSGKRRWSPVVSFRKREISERFSRQVIEALLRKYPDALEPGA